MRRARRDERGVSAVIVVISLTALLSAAMLSIDAGSLWRTRRNLITDTDAGALAAARKIDAVGSPCNASSQTQAEDEARAIVAENDASSVVTGFTVTPTDGDCHADSGRVRVDATLTAQLTFAGVFGFGTVDVASTSIAQWGPLSAATGIRPIGICDKSPHFLAWTRYLAGNEPNWGSLPGQRIGPNGEVINRIYYQRGSSGCGTASGNWDWLDFNGTTNPNGNSALRDWLLTGFYGEVSLGDSATGKAKDCNPDAPGNQDSCDPKTGAGGGSFADALDFLRDQRLVFPILVYDKVIDRSDQLGCATPPPWTGSGTNARFCHVAFLMIRIHGWENITGNLGDNSYFEFEFLDEWWTGTIGRNPSGGRPTAHGVSLCGGGYGTNIDVVCDV